MALSDLLLQIVDIFFNLSAHDLPGGVKYWIIEVFVEFLRFTSMK
jgi:hypothetical protein